MTVTRARNGARPTSVRGSNTRARRMRGADLATFDLLPGCPSCGDLAHRTATVCGCGQRLFPHVSKATNRTSMSGARLVASTEGE